MKTQMEDIRNNADITLNRNDMHNTVDIMKLNERLFSERIILLKYWGAENV